MGDADPKLAQAVSLLARRVWGPEATVVGLARIAGDASSRSYFRARLHGAPPASAVVMQIGGSSLSLSSDELQTLPDRPEEEPFVNVHRYMKRIGAPVPALHDYEQKSAIVLLEDLGDQLLWDAACRASADEARRLYQRAIDTMLTLHVTGTHSPDTSCIAFRQRFDERLFMWEFEHFVEFGIERRLGTQLPAPERDRFRHHFSRLSSTLAGAPGVLSHRDFHSWNILVWNASLFLIDFQDALIAPAQYDLASLLTDRTTAERVTPPAETALIEYYLLERARREKEAGYEFATNSGDFRRLYFLAVLQRALKVIGRFYYLALEREKQDYLDFIPAEVAQVRRAIECAGFDLDLLSAFNSYPWPEDARA